MTIECQNRCSIMCKYTIAGCCMGAADGACRAIPVAFSTLIWTGSFEIPSIVCWTHTVTSAMAESLVQLKNGFFAEDDGLSTSEYLANKFITKMN